MASWRAHGSAAGMLEFASGSASHYVWSSVWLRVMRGSLCRRAESWRWRRDQPSDATEVVAMALSVAWVTDSSEQR